jgi:tripartite-type tricarboxylate transporter receptor subunit TctC
MRRMTFSGACVAALVITLAASLQYAAAQSLAGQQVRLVVPFPAGGPTDIVARPLVQMLGDATKAVVVVDNRGGAGGSLGADGVAKAAPDGRTLLMATVGTHAINPTLYKTLPYDPVRDFTPIGLVTMAPVAIVAHPSQPISTVADLVTLAKRMPGKLNYGSAGAGTPGHLTGEIFKAAAGINIQHVAYRGSAPAVTDLLGGQIQIMFDPLQSILSNVQGGRLRAIAVSSKVRSSMLPNVPTIAESGYAGFETTAWWAVFAPARLPAALAASLTSEIDKIVVSEAFRSKLEPLGVFPTFLGGEKFAEFHRSEIDKWGKAVRESGATAD